MYLSVYGYIHIKNTQNAVESHYWHEKNSIRHECSMAGQLNIFRLSCGLMDMTWKEILNAYILVRIIYII